MLILHMAELDGSLVLWGERSGEDQHEQNGMHPWSATPDDLRTISDTQRDDLFTATVWLPSTDSGPIPSSGVISDTTSNPTKISPWQVAACHLSEQKTIDMLQMTYAQRTLENNAIVGEDMAWWARVLQQVGSMVARQQYLPDVISKENNRYTAVWNPVFAGEDTEWRDAAAAKMPAAARALTSKSASMAPFKPAVAALWDVASNLTDYIVRTTQDRTHRGRRRTRFDSIHDSWLYSLRSIYHDISGTPKTLQHLAEQIHEWQRPIAIMAASPFRLCFRIDEPEKEQDPWSVQYLVQSNDDPSLLIPADAAWNNTERPNLRGQLLFALGQAAEICPGISAGLSRDGPKGHSMDATGAYHFLTHEAEALRQAGYGVMLPAWWVGRGTRQRLAAKARIWQDNTQGSGTLSLDSMLKFDWEVVLGDRSISIEELEMMASLKSPLVKMRGRWVTVSTEEIHAAIDLLKKGHSDGSIQDMVRMDLGVDNIPEGLEWGGISSTDAIQDVLEKLNGRASMEEIKPPQGFVGKLRPYQLRGYAWLSFLRQWGLGGCLADDMGLGKTVQMLALIQQDRRAGEERPALLVCPTSVINNWEREAARFTPDLSVLIHHGASRLRGKAFDKAATDHALVVTSYGLALRDIKAIREVSWSGVVLDEAQNIKNAHTKQAQAIRTIHSDYQFALTGTPVENSVADLWSIMEFLNPGFLGGQEEFRRNFLLPIQARQDKTTAKRLRRATGPFILRRLKTDKSVISDLPDKIEIKEYCTLTKEQATLYASVLQEIEQALEDAEGIQRRGMILGALSKLKQVCNHPAHLLKDGSAIPHRSGKLERLTEMLEEVIKSGDKALIFTQFVEMGHMLKRHIQETFGREVLFLHGGTPRRQRDIMVERFGDEDIIQIFIVSLKAGGTGLNLTAANHVFHFDRWWNPAVEDQATDRAFRIGQIKNVQVRKMICAGTLEEKIDDIIERKKSIAGSVVGTGEGWLTELSNDELREVLALSKEAAS